MKIKDRSTFLLAIKSFKNTSVLYDKDNVIVIEVKSYDECRALFNDCTEWCIAYSNSHWDSYVGEHENSRQYFIINFSAIASSLKERKNNSLIGFTIEDNKIIAAHAKNDRNLFNHDEYVNTGSHPFDKIIESYGLVDFMDELIVKNKSNNKSVYTNVLLAIYSIAFLLVMVLSIGLACGCFGDQKKTKENRKEVKYPSTSKEVKLGFDESFFKADTMKIVKFVNY